MKVIGYKDVRALGISPQTCYAWVSDMILHKRDVLLPTKIHMSMPGNVFCNVMPCIIPGPAESCVGGIKIVTRYPERKPSLDSKIMIFDADTGSMQALMDGNWITAMRTGAVAAHSIMHLARSGWKNVSIIGLGNTARSSLIVLQAVAQRPLNIRLLRYKDEAELFMERFRDVPGIEFTVVDTVEDCIRGADVVVSCATYFENDIATDEWFDEGVLVVPVHTRGFTNCDLFFDRVYADDTGHVRDFRNFEKFRHFAEVSDVVNGRDPGRESDGERILAYNIGLSMHDINFAARVYQLMQQDPERFSCLPDADLQEPADRFWV